MLRKALPVEIEPEDDSRRFTATITTDDVDRDAEVLIAQGMDATEFLKVGTIFYNHNYERPIASQIGDFKRQPHSIRATAKFAPRPGDFEGPWFPDEIRGLVNAGVVKGVSVGFDEVPGGTRSATKADREEFGEGVKRVFSHWKLLEWSIAPLQANPDALIEASHKGVIAPDRCKALFGVDVPDLPRKAYVTVPVEIRREQPTVYVVRYSPPEPKAVAPGTANVDIAAVVRTELKRLHGGLYE